MRTTYIAKEADIVKKWYVIDAEGVTLGRLASEVASILRGKNKPQYAPNADMGDYVIIVNAEKVAVTGKKLEKVCFLKMLWAERCSASCMFTQVQNTLTQHRNPKHWNSNSNRRRKA